MHPRQKGAADAAWTRHREKVSVEQDLAAQLLTQALPLVRIHVAPMATWPERWRLSAMQQRRFRCRQPEMDPPQHIEVPAERQK